MPPMAGSGWMKGARGAAGRAIACVAAVCGSAHATGDACAALRADGGVSWPLEAVTARGADGASVLDGRRGTFHGTVTRLVADGFFLQDPFPDPARGGATPSGVFVWSGREGPPAGLQPGDALRLDARIASWRGGAKAAAPPRRPTLELVGAHALRVLGHGCLVAPVTMAWPPASEADAMRREGMVVALPQPFTIQDVHLPAPRGERLLAAGGRQRAPTDVVAPGLAAHDLEAAQARARLLVDDGDGDGTPEPARAGDVVDGLVGVLDTGPTGRRAGDPRAWRVHPVAPVRVVHANPRPVAPPAVGGDARIASANVENFFLTPADGRPGCAPSGRRSDCRGARDRAAFDRQLAKLAAMLSALDADVLALMELQNDGDRAAAAIAMALNARMRTAAWTPVIGAPGGRDAIRVGLLYRADRVKPLGGPRVDTDPVHGRLPVAQVFQWPGGARVAVIASHFRSKRCVDAGPGASTSLLDADQHDGQACGNARRVAQAHALRRFAAAVARENGGVDTLLVGDFNAYAREDPVVVLREGGWIEAGEDAAAPTPRYSFVHDGRAGRLDHAFANASLAPRVSGAAEWHVDADEPEPADAADATGPFRASDHDPLLVGLRLGRTPAPAEPRRQ
jgi:hypothetical protein